MSDYYFRTQNSKLHTYRSPYLANSFSRSQDRNQKNLRTSLSSKNIRITPIPHRDERLSNKKDTIKEPNFDKTKSNDYRNFRKIKKIEEDQNPKEQQNDSRDTSQNQSKELNVTPMTIPKERQSYKIQYQKNYKSQRKLNYPIKNSDWQSFDEPNNNHLLKTDGKLMKLSPAFQTQFGNDDFENENWALLQQLKRENFELNQMIQRKDFEVQELEQESEILLRKNNILQNKITKNQTTLSNQYRLNSQNEKITLNIIKTLIKQAERELVSIQPNSTYLNDDDKKIHFQNLQRIFGKLSEKFQSDFIIRDLIVKNEIIDKIDQIISTNKMEEFLEEQLLDFKQQFITTNQSYDNFILSLQQFLDEKETEITLDDFTELEQEIFQQIHQLIQHQQPVNDDQNFQSQIVEFEKEIKSLAKALQNQEITQKSLKKKLTFSQKQHQLAIQNEQRKSEIINELREQIQNLQKQESDFEILKLKQEDELEEKMQLIKELHKKLEISQQEQTRLQKQIQEIQDTNKFMTASRLQKNSVIKDRTMLQQSIIQQRITKEINENDKLEELFSNGDEQDDLSCDHQLQQLSKSEIVRKMDNSDKLYKSLNFQQFKHQQVDDNDESYQMEEVKELINNLIEEKDIMQKDYKNQIANLEHEIQVLLKKEKDYQIELQKAKIDEIVKNQWKKERDEAKKIISKLQIEIKQLTINRDQIHQKYLQMCQETQDLNLRMEYQKIQEERNKLKKQCIQLLKNQEIMEDPQILNKIQQLEQENLKKNKIIENFQNQEKGEEIIKGIDLQIENEHLNKKIQKNQEYIKELEESNKELIEINYILRNRKNSEQQQQMNSDSIFSVEDLNEEDQNIENFNLD